MFPHVLHLRTIPRLLLLTAALLVGSCGKDVQPPATATAPTTPPAATGPRIVSTVPAATLNLILIGAVDRLVGVSKYDRLHLPAEKQTLPVVGDYEDINYEQLIQLKPNFLVIQKAPSRIAPRLLEIAAQHNIEILNMRFDHVEDIWASVRMLGKAADSEHTAELAIKRAQDELKDLADEYKDKPHPKVAYMINAKMIVGGKTFIDEIITAAGGDNAGRGAGEGFLDINNETLVSLSPDVILIGAPGEVGLMEGDPRLQPYLRLATPASRRGRIYLVTNSGALDASVDIGRNVRALADLIHKNPAGGTP